MRYYTEKEDAVIIGLWETHNVQEISAILNRTEASVMKRAQRLNVKKKLRIYKLYRNHVHIYTGTAEECAKESGLTAEYIRWLTYPTKKKRMEKRKYKGELRFYYWAERV